MLRQRQCRRTDIHATVCSPRRYMWTETTQRRQIATILSRYKARQVCHTAHRLLRQGTDPSRIAAYRAHQNIWPSDANSRRSKQLWRARALSSACITYPSPPKCRDAAHRQLSREPGAIQFSRTTNIQGRISIYDACSHVLST